MSFIRGKGGHHPQKGKTRTIALDSRVARELEHKPSVLVTVLLTLNKSKAEGAKGTLALMSLLLRTRSAVGGIR